MFLPQFILSMVFIIGGILLLKYPPKKVNPLLGYRTARSMKTQDAWNYAQRISARRMTLSGLVGLSIFIIASIVECNEGIHAVLMLATLALTFFYIFYSVERDLKRKFPDVRP